MSFDGPALNPGATASAATASLTGPDGPVDVAVVDNTTAGLVNYLPTGMEVIPRAALKPMATYTASVTATVTPFGGGAGMPFAATWTFTTDGAENAVAISGMSASSAGDLTVRVTSTAPDATVTATGPGTAATAAAAGGSAVLRLDRRGAWHVCVASGGAGTTFRAAQACQDIGDAGVDPAPVVVVAPVVVKPVAVAAIASFARGAKARLRGRVLSVPIRCSAGCALKVAGTLIYGKRRLALRAVSVKRAGAGSVTARFRLSKAAARRVRGARTRRIALTVTARPTTGGGTATVRRTLAVA